MASAAWAQDGSSLALRVLVGLERPLAQRLEKLLVRLEGAGGAKIAIRAGEPGFELPEPDSFDVLVAWPAGQALAALDAGKLQRIDKGKPLIQLGARPYALLENGVIGPWDRLVRLALDGSISLPDPFAEPAFLDALAAWASHQPVSRVETLLRNVTFRGTSKELRAGDSPAIIALEPDAKLPANLPRSMLVIAVSAKTHDAARARSLALDLHAHRSEWFPSAWGHKEVWVALPLEIARFRDQLRGPGADRPTGRAEDWFDTTLLIIFGLGFVLIVLRAAQRPKRQRRT